ncbi:MAG TPA: hypothetical protein VFU71_07040 [Burkholderiaceae bacterium]|nr:hypothetical protein [Burkholderiaceae bacterium]
MEATPYQIVGCVFCAEPAAQRIDGFVMQARRERAVVTAKNARQATFVRFGAADGRLIALACQATGSAEGPALRFGFARSGSERALQAKEGVRVSSRSIAQATDLAAGARDGEVLLSAEVATLLTQWGFAFESREVHLPGGRTAVSCALAAAAPDAPASVDDAGQAGHPVEADPAPAPHSWAAQPEATRRAQRDLQVRQDAMLEQMASATTRLDAIASQVTALAQTLERSQHAVGALEERVRHSQDDQQTLLDRCGDVAELRERVEDLMARLSDTDGKIERIESRRKVVEEVQSRAEGITHMLEDIHVNLEMLGEQRAVIDEVGEKLARLEFTLQEAGNTLRALQREREVAERIEQGIKALRAHSGAGKVSAGR